MAVTSSFQHFVRALVEIVHGVLEGISGFARWPVRMLADVTNSTVNFVACAIEWLTGEQYPYGLSCSANESDQNICFLHLR